VAFLLSAGVAYFLSHRLGLFRPQTDSMEPAARRAASDA
jgi:hypothetical protein